MRDEIVGWRVWIWSNGHAARPGQAAQPRAAAGWGENPFRAMVIPIRRGPMATAATAIRSRSTISSWVIAVSSRRPYWCLLRTLGGQGSIRDRCCWTCADAARGSCVRLRHHDERKDVVARPRAPAGKPPKKALSVSHGASVLRVYRTPAPCYFVVAEMGWRGRRRVRS